MLPVGQLAKHLSVAKVQRYSAKGAGVCVGGVSPHERGSGGPPPGKFYLRERPESGFQAI
mgnify:FL=1